MNNKLIKEAKDFIREVIQYTKDHEENPTYYYPEDDSAHIYYFDGTSEFFSATSGFQKPKFSQIAYVYCQTAMNEFDTEIGECDFTVEEKELYFQEIAERFEKQSFKQGTA